MLCPLLKSDCVERKCAWYDNGNKCCAVLGILIERVKATEAVQDSAGGRSVANVEVNPVVQVREIIKTIPIPEVKHDNAASDTPDQASETSPKITW
jgi:hypothetical protein